VETQRQAKQGQERKDEPEPQLEELEPGIIHDCSMIRPSAQEK